MKKEFIFEIALWAETWLATRLAGQNCLSGPSQKQPRNPTLQYQATCLGAALALLCRPTGRGTAWPERALARLGAVSADARTPLGVAGGDSTTSKWRAQSQREDHRLTEHSLGKAAWVAVHRIKVAASRSGSPVAGRYSSDGGRRRGSRSLRRDPAQSEGG
jgi:hypothetical protein